MKFEFSRQIFLKSFKYQVSSKSVHWKPSCSMRTDVHEANSRFRNFANAPKNWSITDVWCSLTACNLNSRTNTPINLFPSTNQFPITRSTAPFLSERRKCFSNRSKCGSSCGPARLQSSPQQLTQYFVTLTVPFEVVTSLPMELVFWYETICILIEIYLRFGEIFCLYLEIERAYSLETLADLYNIKPTWRYMREHVISLC